TRPPGRRPRARTAALRLGRSSETWGRGSCSNRGRRPSRARHSRRGLRRLEEPCFLLPAPRDVELGICDPVPEHEVHERRIVHRARLDLAQERQELLVPGPAHPQLLDGLLPREGVREEQLQEALVTELGHRGRRFEPPQELGSAGRRQLVLLPLPRARRRARPLDEAGLLEPPELRVDLPVARRPEKARRLVDTGFDVISGADAKGQHSEDDVPGAAQRLHVASGYIATIYVSSDDPGITRVEQRLEAALTAALACRLQLFPHEVVVYGALEAPEHPERHGAVRVKRDPRERERQARLRVAGVVDEERVLAR